MTPSRDPTTLICAGLYILGTGMLFCYFYIVAALVSIFISVVSVAMYLDPYVWVRLLGRSSGDYRIDYAL